MLKIIELEIDSSLTGETGVFEVAWVEYPAIEQEMMYFGRQMFYVAPEYVSEKACQAIKENEKRGNPAGTQVGKVRAQQLCSKSEISLETVKRMKSFLERAKVYDTGNWDDNGTIAMGLWGGVEALSWVDKILNQIENQENSQAFVESGGGFSVGDYVSWTYAGRGQGDDRARGQIEDIRIQGEVTVPGTDFTLTATEERPVALIRTAEDKIVGQYTDNLRQIQKPENFVYPSPGEPKEEFISRCIAEVIAEGKSEAQAAGQCYGMWENRNFAQDKVSFDWNNTLDGGEAIRAFENERRRGSLIYIITALPILPKKLIEFSNKYNIPSSRIFAVGSNRNKVQKVLDLGIQRHYDDNIEVRNALGNVGQRFDYDISALPAYESYPTSGDPKAMQVKPVLMNEDCGCLKQEFDLMGFIDGQPVFSTPEEATLYGESQGCEGYHEHTMDDGKTVYMGCDIHSAATEFDFSSWDKEDLEIKKLVDDLKNTGNFEFEYITNPLLRGYTREDIVRINHKNPVKYYLYKRVLTGSPDRPFCLSLEGRYFRLSQIYALENFNTEFGHNKQPYSKWLYKGGPSCVHAWEEWSVINDRFQNNGMVPGKPGTPPKNLPNNGYFDETTKRASEIAYIISQQNMSEQKFVGDLEPIGYLNDLPIYEDIVTAQDASFAMGCGGLYESVMFEGKKRFQACSFKGQKAETQRQQYAAVEEKRMIYTPLMIPNILIPRIDETTGERYWVKFKEETIFNIAKKFAIEGRNRMTNLEHSETKFNDIVMVESWIVDGDSDKAYELGFSNEYIPSGTWMGGFYILPTEEGDMVLNEYIKPGKVRGASVEGNFILNFSSIKDDDYLLKQIINILKKISE